MPNSSQVSGGRHAGCDRSLADETGPDRIWFRGPNRVLKPVV